MTAWFTACWLFATAKDGIPAPSLKRTLEIGSYQTAWTMLQRLRAVLVRPGRERLAGVMEVDETYIGGEEPRPRGGRAQGKKVLTGVAVEVREGMGRCRIAPLADASAASLHRFVADHVEPGATVITDGWQGYSGLRAARLRPRQAQPASRRSRGEETGKLLPAVHQVSSLAKRWLLGTHQGLAEETHLASYPTSSCFASTVGAPGAGGWCSFVCLNSPSPTTRCATRTSEPTVDLGESRQRRRGRAGTRQVWCDLRRTVRGEQRGRATPVNGYPQQIMNSAMEWRRHPSTLSSERSGQ